MYQNDLPERRAAGLASAVTGLTLSAVAGPAAWSQAANDSVAAGLGQEVEEVVVTGSRIARGNLTAPSPVTVLGASEVDARGSIRVEDLLNTLPQVSPAEGSGRANEATGTATVDLRGLGAERTLVLVNGKRMPYGSPIAAPADLNQIPAQLVERVEVLTGGASAVYGADAVAGVVNFIMRDDFEGIQLDFQGGAFQSGNNNDRVEAVLTRAGQPVPGGAFDGRSVDFNVIVGTNTPDGRGNFTAYFNWRNQNQVLQGDRISSACALGTANQGRDFACIGSSTTAPALFSDFGQAEVPFEFTLDGQGGIRPFNPETDTFNFAPLNHFIRPGERFSGGAFVRYNVFGDSEAYMDFAFHDDRTTAQIAPAGNFFQTDTINCDNPFLSPQQVQVICLNNGVDPAAAALEDRNAVLQIGRRNVEGGPRRNEIRHTSYRVIGGLKGSIDDNWQYDVFGQYATVTYRDVASNFLDTAKLQQSLIVRIDPETGQPACQSAIDGSTPDCAPWNPFQVGGVTQEALDFLQSPGFRTGNVTQKVFGGTLSGDLTKYGVQSPWADFGLQTVIGFEYREETLDQRNDELTRSGRLGVARPDVSGDIGVYEVFTEVQMPLVQGRFLIDELSLNGAYRFSDFWRTTGAQHTYSVGLTYAPSPDVRLRGQYQRATRSPNPIELFSPQAPFEFVLTQGANGQFDPCAGANPTASLEACQRTGVTAQQYGRIADNPAGQFRSLAGGNADLDVEKADTFTAGAVITPGMVPGLSVSIDYFNIEVDGFIGTVPPEIAINNCLDTGDTFFCGLINRGPGGSLWVGDDSFVVATNLNTGSLSTSGLDLSLNYTIGLGKAGDLRVDYLATYLLSLDQVPLPGENKVECAGFYAGPCGVSSPEYRHRLPVTWMSPWGDFMTQLTWRYFGSVDQIGATPAPVNATLGSENYIDLSLSKTVYKTLELRAGVNNLFDNNPPVSSAVGGGGGTFGNGNTYPQVYDALGRYLFIGATATF
ncbi:hypothetical protein CCR85_12875 [Rhodothalassium salexigens]|uniref:TonB-dependent receptor plug domain-containing protein n=1 Tax=Rhodothalassium salexigens TaxID=1086 RepID=UPI001913D157|nr:TonB-dependent receptor [Rhodothalassium salexigens]MBK5912378.1 hypothetical protein [Rhodothalassium salexigens]MBK5920201.1 hypothetical protein [Rhodothalassium salexigens]